VSVDLASGEPGGEAGERDTFVAVEGLYGGTGADTLRGDDAPNFLYGQEGDDTLDGRGGSDDLAGWSGDDTIIGGAGRDSFSDGAGDDVLRLDNPPGEYDNYLACEAGDDVIVGPGPAPSITLSCDRIDFGGGLALSLVPRRVTTSYVQLSIPCPDDFRVGGTCAGKLSVEPQGAFRRSAAVRYRQRFGARGFRFTTRSAKVTVPLNAAGRRELRKRAFKLQFTLRLRETESGAVRELAWTQYMTRFELRRLGVG
jgi:hypothetical protein